MAAMDYFLGDAQLPCPGTEAFFSETVYRLPKTECCFRPIGNVPVGPAPCLERGYITFGCFNNPQKITREVVMLWSAVLHLVRNSRLLLKFHRLETEVRQAPLREWFQANGIEPKRVLFEGRSDPTQYLAAYNGIDIALDPFPYNGGSTTLDALWMGVPVVSLAGRLAVQRGGASVLTAAGWPDLVAHTPELYLKIALFLAATVAKEPELRCDIRKALLASPLMDEVGLVRSLEDAFRDMWRTWCRTKS
jgi:predicted O-linked N-acetylglucosamine transferase (SPINDLY family)